MKFICLIILLFSSISCFALETDNYIAWKKELRDSSAFIDRYFEENISKALKKIGNTSMSCTDVTMEVAKEFASHLVHDNPVENWLFQVLNSEEIFPGNLYYVEASIYREPYRFYIPWFGLAPTIQVNGHYFGTDKLSHFASTGMIYFKTYLKELRKGYDHESAMKAAINWGVQDEKSVHGFWASGVFSFADLESNFQGLLFYLNFCEGDHPYLQQEDGEWNLIRKPEIKNYVSGLWDESFEQSYRLPENWEKVSLVLKERYCPMANDPEVRKRINHYRLNLRPGFSKNYLEELKTAGAIPDPNTDQSFSALCSTDI